ncbi:MAG: hypothetical protein ABIK92_02535 [Pseudomonadota bacterium]
MLLNSRYRLHYSVIFLLLLVFIPSAVFALEFSAGNPTEITPGSTATIAVEGGIPPYTWSVKANGMNLPGSRTADALNSIVADTGACGGAEIVVADQSGAKISKTIDTLQILYQHRC